MKRYFEFVGKKQVVELDITPGTPAATATEEQFGKHFKCEVRELTKTEHDKLAKEFE